eukprot:962138-Prymnesium_polylepis.2
MSSAIAGEYDHPAACCPRCGWCQCVVESQSFCISCRLSPSELTKATVCTFRRGWGGRSASCRRRCLMAPSSS